MHALLMAVMLQAATPSFRTIDRGAQSLLPSSRQVTATTAAEWQALWRTHSPDRPAPALDFSREMVVGVFLGSRPTPGYGVNIAAVRDEPGGVVVQYRETRPEPDRILAQVLTSPYELVAIPKRTGAVRFEKID